MYEFDHGTIYNGDCLDIMPSLQDKSIDMILADLPYGITACKWDIVIPLKPLWTQYKRLIKNNGVIVLFGSEPFSSHLRLSNLKMYKYDWIWCKNKPSGMAYCNKRPMLKHEIISVFGGCNYYPQKVETESEKVKEWHNKGYGVSTEHKSIHNANFTSRKNKINRMVMPHTQLKFDVVHGRSKIKIHPTQKPVALFEYLIKTYTNEGDTVLDNVIGSGTTAIAAYKTGRRWIGIEKDKAIYDQAVERIERETANGLLFTGIA